MTPPPSGVVVWDRPVRWLHAALIVLVAGAWWTGDTEDRVHPWFGYGVALAIAVRVLWGFVGSDPARFTSWFRGRRATLVA